MKLFKKALSLLVIMCVAGIMSITFYIIIQDYNNTLKYEERTLEISRWIGKFQEFSEALSDYDSINTKTCLNLFPSDFQVLEKYGKIKRSNLLSCDDFGKFQNSVTIDVMDFDAVAKIKESGYSDESIVIMHKTLYFEVGSKVTIELTLSGNVRCK